MITSIQNALQNVPIAANGVPGSLDSVAVPRQPLPQPVSTGDVVNVQAPYLMSDEEAALAMNAVQDTCNACPAEALSVHGGLDYDRVMALLGGL